MDIGDIIFYKYDNDNLEEGKNQSQNILILERKTINDLKCSLADGRFSEQKKRLSNTDFIHKGYIIEGNSERYPDFKYMLQQLIIRIQLKDRMCVFHTIDINETVDLISELCRKLEKDAKLYNFSLVTSYIETLNVCKKKNLTPSLCFVLQISQIPGISKKIAESLASVYPNWNLLTQGLENKEVFMRTTKNMNIGKKKFEQLKTYISDL